MYAAPDDPDGLVAQVAAMARGLGAPDEPEVGIAFDRSEVTVTVEAGRRGVVVRWRAGGDCRPPFEVLSTPPDGAPGWVTELHRTLPARFAHRPRLIGVRRPLPPRWSAALPWAAWLVALLLWWTRRPPPKRTSRPERSRAGWAVVGAAGIGLALLAVRWATGVTTDDEVAYLALPGLDPQQVWTLAYYLNDPGLPSLVHRAAVMALYPLAGRSGVTALHGVLYLTYGWACWRLARALVPGGLAAAVAAACLLHPRVLLYFGEHRSYASFLTFAALGQWGFIRYVLTADPRLGLAAAAALGLAALDNPLCLSLPAAAAVTMLAWPAWRRGLHLWRWLGSTVLLAVAVMPAAVTATQAARHASAGSVSQWLVATAALAGPVALWGVRRTPLGGLRVMVPVVVGLVGAAMWLSPLPVGAGKVELFALPILASATAAAMDRGWAGRAALAGLAAIYSASLNLPSEAAELNTPAIAAQVRAVDDGLHERALQERIEVYFARPFKRTEYAGYLTDLDPFTTDARAIGGLSGHYRFVDDGWPRARCGAGRPFYVVAAPYASPPECATCSVAVADTHSWHAWRCR